jgi:hypothetical protein
MQVALDLQELELLPVQYSVLQTQSVSVARSSSNVQQSGLESTSATANCCALEPPQPPPPPSPHPQIITELSTHPYDATLLHKQQLSPAHNYQMRTATTGCRHSVFVFPLHHQHRLVGGRANCSSCHSPVNTGVLSPPAHPPAPQLQLLYHTATQP